MRVQELLAEETVKQYVERLTSSLNIKKLGTGYYASVFQHPLYKNVAVKVFEWDPEYLAYIKICQKMTNKWMPRVVSVHTITMDEEKNRWHIRFNEQPGKTKGTIVFFEKLRPAKHKEIVAAMEELCKDVPEEHQDDLLDDLSFADWGTGHWQIVKRFAKDKDTKKFAELAVRLRFMDIHNENVMIRDDGQLVFTDPVAS